MNKKYLRWLTGISILAFMLLAVCLVALCLGSAGIPVKKIFPLLLGGRGSTEYSILFDIRLPRIILGLAVGGGLALAGVILQGMFRNPLVEPYTLGISGGAALGVSLNIVFKFYKTLGVMTFPFFGFLGALAVIGILYLVNLRKATVRLQGLLLNGVMISFISSSLIMLMMSLSRAEDIHGIVFWIMGSLDEPNWFIIKITALAAVLLFLLSYLFCRDLNAFALGEEEAAHLGIPVERSKQFLFIIASLLAGFGVSSAGMIGFVGLVVPHFVRMFTGPDHRILMPASFLAGGAFLIFCDTLARTVISPVELPVGVITGILGGSFFIYALSRKGNS
ncbi:MAG: iron ABC transporter permease [Candidatus Omnitrophica bacterium]|jgi:iron complex transport system permease protein|nr:iron ABC transporter permease [Candidatus Omnitrophota bacterium]MDD5077637.1 iron ABC transporter permease [Candidatus Omnitrophota bacterium]